MRKLIVTEYVSLDGVMEEPGKWSLPFWNEEAAKFKFDELFDSDALLLGRLTYEGFAKAWPSMKDEAGFADRMNNLPKYVVTKTMISATWNNSTILTGSIREEVTKLKQQPGQAILVAGSGALVHTLKGLDLIDEYRFMLHPVILGNGKRLFGGETDKLALELVDVQRFKTGILVLTYHPSAAAPG